MSAKPTQPCPFCAAPGSLKAGRTIGMGGSTQWVIYVQCDGCGATGPQVADGAYQPDGAAQKAVDAWDSRILGGN
jgi:ribosomal protein L37AE/L43A